MEGERRLIEEDVEKMVRQAYGIAKSIIGAKDQSRARVDLCGQILAIQQRLDHKKEQEQKGDTDIFRQIEKMGRAMRNEKKEERSASSEPRDAPVTKLPDRPIHDHPWLSEEERAGLDEGARKALEEIRRHEAREQVEPAAEDVVHSSIPVPEEKNTD